MDTQRCKVTKEQIHELMRLKGWSQNELARQLMVNVGTVSYWLSGKHPIPGPARLILRHWLVTARAEAGLNDESSEPAIAR